MVLNPSEYDNAYFDPKTTDTSGSTANSVLAGYSDGYKRWFRVNGNDPESANNDFADYARRFFNEQILMGKNVLELGCAKGFVVEDLRALGANAVGIDVSAYAIGQASPAIQPFLTVADARTHLATYARNQFDVVYSMRYFECVADADLPGLITQISRIGRLSVHWIGTQENAVYYNNKPLTEWLAMGWARRTRLIDYNNQNNILVK